MIMQRRQGFSLIELLIALTILAILTAVAYPSYTRYMTKSRRTDGQIALLDLAARMERFYSENNTYVGATIGTGGVLTKSQSPEGWYTLRITSQTATSYGLQATPQNQQASNDVQCGNLSLDSFGVKSESGSGTTQDCW